MDGLGHWLKHLETASMLERGDFAACRGHFGRIDSCQHHAGLGAAFGEHVAPRVDDKRVAVRLAPVLMLAALRRRQDEGPVLDGARPIEHVPNGLRPWVW